MAGVIGDLRGFRRPVYVVSGGQFINVLGAGVVYPFATLYFYRAVGIPFTLVGLGLFANSVGTAAGNLLGGTLADRYGRRPVMVASMALSAGTLAAYALVRTAPAFVAVASAAGLTLGLYTPASQAMIADLTEENRERAYGLLKVANNAGFGLGFVAGGLLYGLAKTSVFVVNGLTSGVVALLLLVALPRSHPGGVGASARGPAPGPTAPTIRETLVGWGRAVSRRRVLAVALLNVGFAVAYAQMQSTVPVVAEGRLGLSSEQIGTLFVLNPLVIVLFQLPVVSWVRRRSWRRTRGLVVSTGFWAASFVAVLVSYGTPRLVGVALVAAFLVLRTLGEILHAPLVTALVSDMSAAETRGSQLSVLEVAKRLGFGIGPVIGGAFFDHGLQVWLWPALVFMCAGIAAGLLALELRVTPAENGLAAPD